MRGRRKFLKRIVVPLLAASALTGGIVASADASGQRVCGGTWHVWTSCGWISSAIAQAKVQAFSTASTPYYVQFFQGNGDPGQMFGPFNDLSVHTLQLRTVGNTLTYFYNNHSTSTTGTYNLTIN